MKFYYCILMASILSFGCTKDRNSNEYENLKSKNVFLREIKNVSQQLGIQMDSKKFKDIKMAKSSPNEITSAIHYRQIKLSQNSSLQRTSTENASLDTANAVTYTFILNDGNELVSIMIPYSNEPNEYFNFIESGNEEMGMDLETEYNSQTGTLSMRAKGPFGGWWGCMKNFYGSNGGTFVNIMGTAGGLGCVACGIIAGFTTGIMAIACIHG